MTLVKRFQAARSEPAREPGVGDGLFGLLHGGRGSLKIQIRRDAAGAPVAHVVSVLLGHRQALFGGRDERRRSEHLVIGADDLLARIELRHFARRLAAFGQARAAR